MTQKERDTKAFFNRRKPPLRYPTSTSPRRFHMNNPEVRKDRVARIAKITASLIAEGHIVFSPVAASAEIQKHGDPPAGWYHFTLRQLAACTHLRVVKMDGWQESEGISEGFDKPLRWARGYRLNMNPEARVK